MIHVNNQEKIAGQSQQPGSYHEASVHRLVNGSYTYIGIPNHTELFLGLGCDYKYITSAFESSSAGRIKDAYTGLEALEREHPETAEKITVCGSATLQVALHAYGYRPVEDLITGEVHFQKTAKKQISDWLEAHPSLAEKFVNDSAEAPLKVLNNKKEYPVLAICPQAAGEMYTEQGLVDLGNASNKVGGTKFYLFSSEGHLDTAGSHFLIKMRVAHTAGGLLLPLSLVTDRHNLSDLSVYNVNGHDQVSVLTEFPASREEVDATIKLLHENGVDARIYGQYTPYDERVIDHDEKFVYEEYDFTQHTLDWGTDKEVVALECLDTQGQLTEYLRVVDRIGVNLLGLDVPIAPMNQHFQRPIVLVVSAQHAQVLAENLDLFHGNLTFSTR